MDLRLLCTGVVEGALYVLAAPLALCAALATCLLLGTFGRAPAPSLLGAFVAAATIMRWLPVVGKPILVPLIVLALGLLLAWKGQVRGPATLAIGMAGGVGAGLGGGMQFASWPELIGGDVILAALLATVSIAMALVGPRGRLSRPEAVGRRMAGAWIAAIGALMLALSWNIV